MHTTHQTRQTQARVVTTPDTALRGDSKGGVRFRCLTPSRFSSPGGVVPPGPSDGVQALPAGH
eukprot:7111801-Pyramimonas_sp.AAC.1